jgi:hypothetical protein
MLYAAFFQSEGLDFKAIKTLYSPLSLFSVAFGIILFYKAFEWFKFKKLIENIPSSKIRSIAMGLVEVYGNVMPVKGKTIKAPYSQRDCVYYRYIVDKSSEKYGEKRKTIKEGEERTPFFIADDTGKVLVNPEGAILDYPDYSLYYKYETFKETRGFLGRKSVIRCREYVIEANDRLYIMGTAAKNPSVKETTAKSNTANVIIQKGENDKVFYIYESPESEFLNDLSMWRYAIIMSFLLITIGAYLLI